MRKLKYAGGWHSIRYSFQMAKKAGGFGKLYRALKNPNTCKVCALGMGGSSGGMIDEVGHTLEVCKKSMQAQVQDMQPAISSVFFKENSIEDIEKLSGRELESLGRIGRPLYNEEGDSHYKVLDWNNALEILIENWRGADVNRSFFYTSGRSSIEAGFLVQLLARQWGTNNVNNCSYYCHQASGVGLTLSLGSGTSTIELRDIGKSDLVVLIGSNPSSNHPRLLTHLMKLKRRGGKVIVMNPFKELGLQRFKIPSDIRSLLFGTKISDLYLQPHCGGDLAFLKAAAVRILEKDSVDRGYVENHCEEESDFYSDLESQNVDSLLQKSGLSEADLNSFCEMITNSKRTIFAWAMGVTHHLHGSDTVRAITNLALLRGMIGKEGAGLLPIRGHSNVQGIGTVGVVPKLKPEIAKLVSSVMKFELPSQEGKDTFACMEAAHRGEIDFTFIIGGNLYGANPNQKWASESLQKINFITYLSTTMNKGHLLGRGKSTLILPVLARDEEREQTTQESMFSYVRVSSGGGTSPNVEMHSESQLLSHLGEALLGNTPVPWNRLTDHDNIRKFISETIPDLEQIKDISKGREFTIPGRIKHKPNFNTPTGKAKLAVLEAPDARPESGKFNLMTFRSEGQFNTIVYEEEDVFRGVEHRNVIFMSTEDIKSNELQAGNKVLVESSVGSMSVELIKGAVRRGNVAMYFPEANEIVPGRVDPKSKTPSFKRTQVKISPL